MFAGCGGLTDGTELPQKTIKYIQELGILDQNEPILYYSTSYSFSWKVSGNFVTEKRVASFWQNHSPEDYVSSAYFEDIESIDIKYGDGFEFASALIIKTKNGEVFEAYFGVDGDRERMDNFYGEVVELWEKRKNKD